MKLNLDYVREQFPAIKSEWTFMDNAGGSQTLKPVADRIYEYLLNTNVQLGASYEVSAISTKRVDDARKKMVDFVNAREDSEIILGSSTTMLTRILSLCISQNWKAGDEIIVTNCDHEANIGAWRDLEKQGMVIKEWRINPDTFRMETEDLKILLSDKTKLVAVTHTSNILGTLNPIKEWSKVIHDNGSLICIDGVAHAPHRAIDVQDTDVDFYTFSFYKVYGPHMAMMYGKKELLLNMPGINHFFIAQDDVPYKFQPGSVNYELSYGLMGIEDYMNGVARTHGKEGSFRENLEFSFNLFADHEEVLAKTLLDYLNSKSNVKIIGEKDYSKEVRVPTIAFMVDNTKSDSISLKVDESKIGIRYGDFYARRLIDDLGLSDRNGVVRVSLVHYNTVEEVNSLIQEFEKIF